MTEKGARGACARWRSSRSRITARCAGSWRVCRRSYARLPALPLAAGYFDVPESEVSEPPKAALPHYALPNFSVVLPEYANAEADIIRNAFRTANYTSISNLPEGIKNGTVNESRFERIVSNRQPAADGTAAGTQGETALFGQMRRLPDKTNKAKYFMEFEYQPSPYSLAEELAREERAESKRKITQAGHQQDFVPADARKRLPHEDVAGKFTEYIIDPFECAGDQVLRQKWLMDAQVLAAPFKPAGRSRGPSGATNTFAGRQQLPGARGACGPRRAALARASTRRTSGLLSAHRAGRARALARRDCRGAAGRDRGGLGGAHAARVRDGRRAHRHPLRHGDAGAGAGADRIHERARVDPRGSVHAPAQARRRGLERDTG